MARNLLYSLLHTVPFSTSPFFLILSLFLLISCEKELDFQYHDVSAQLVVEAQITELGSTVSLTETTPMNEPMDLTHLVDATVTVTDLSDGTILTLLPDAEGVFTNPTPGIVGHDYRVDIERDGKSYSSAGTMLSPTEITTLDFQWIKMPYDYVAVLKVEFTALPGDDDCYWIRLFRNGEPYSWDLVDERNAADGVVSEVIMTSRRDTDEEDEKDVLLDGDVVTVSVTLLSRSLYDYFTSLSADSNGPRMFEGDFCLGYFITATSATSSITFHPDRLTEYK